MNLKKVASSPAQYLVDNHYRLTLYSPSLIRIEFSKQGLLDERNPLIIHPSFNEEVPHKINLNKGELLLSTEFYRLKLLLNMQPFDVGNLTFTVHNGPKETLWEPGMTDNENIGGAMSDLFKFPEGKSGERFSEGIISRKGHFVYRNNCEFLWDEKENWAKKKPDWGSQDWYLFGYGRDYKRAFSDFIKLFGKIPIPPKWAFGYWYSKWYKFKDSDILDIINTIKEKEMPLDVFVIDTDWRKHGWNGYEWNQSFFPDHKKFLKELKNMSIHCCLNDHPGYGTSDELPIDDPYREKIKSRISHIKDFRCRWSDEKYVRAWVEEIFAPILKEGVDFWWVDGGGATDGIPDINAQMWLNRFYYEAAQNAGDNRRAMILSRWGGIGSHRYPVQFSGDTYSSFETLKYQIAYTHKGGNVGASYWSHDIGGFLGEKLPDDLFIRWLQFGCFSPIFRTHSSGNPREPWNYSAAVLDVFKKYTRVRYALFPYFYTLARECFNTGFPLMRGLYLEYPNDPNAYANDEEYLIGPSILSAPAYGPGKYFEREIYFPKGKWISLEENEIIKGPCHKKIKVPLDKIPLYVKEGAIIPTIPRRENLSGPISGIEWNIFPSQKAHFSYYEDDGLTEKYRAGESLAQQVELNGSKKEIRVEIHPALGGYAACPAEIAVKVNIFVNRKKPKSLFVNGKRQKIQYTDIIFSGTVKSRFKFISIEFGPVKRDRKIEIVLK